MNDQTSNGEEILLAADMLELTTDIVSAYVSNNIVPSAELPNLIAEVHKALNEVQAASVEPEKPELVPAINPKKSVSNDYIVCLEDGKRFKSLKRHLTSHYNMTPDEYREKWGLPSDYPMVAPSYSERRSRLAKEKGLGRKKGEKVKR